MLLPSCSNYYARENCEVYATYNQIRYKFWSFKLHDLKMCNVHGQLDAVDNITAC